MTRFLLLVVYATQRLSVDALELHGRAHWSDNLNITKQAVPRRFHSGDNRNIVEQAEGRRLQSGDNLNTERAEGRRLQSGDNLNTEQAEARRLQSDDNLNTEQAEGRRLQSGDKLMVGYLMSWDKAVKISEAVDKGYNCIALAFGTVMKTTVSVHGDRFPPYGEGGGAWKAPMKADIAAARAKGLKCVLLSLGGGRNTFNPQEADVTALAANIVSFTREFGGDGVDFDLEDTQTTGTKNNPSNIPGMGNTTPEQRAQYLAKLVKAVRQKDASFLITCAPQVNLVGASEVNFVNTKTEQMYKDSLCDYDYIMPQLYNTAHYCMDSKGIGSKCTGSKTNVNQEHPDFVVNSWPRFMQILSACPKTKVVPGMPSVAEAGGATVHKGPFASEVYTKLCSAYKQISGDPKYGGIMTWSVNQDAGKGWPFVSGLGSCQSTSGVSTGTGGVSNSPASTPPSGTTSPSGSTASPSGSTASPSGSTSAPVSTPSPESTPAPASTPAPSAASDGSGKKTMAIAALVVAALLVAAFAFYTFSNRSPPPSTPPSSRIVDVSKSQRKPVFTPKSQRKPVFTPKSQRKPVFTPKSQRKPVFTPKSQRKPNLSSSASRGPSRTSNLNRKKPSVKKPPGGRQNGRKKKSASHSKRKPSKRR